MDEELMREISTIASLAHGPLILPDASSAHTSCQSDSKDNTSQKKGVRKDSAGPSQEQIQIKPAPKHYRKYLGMKFNELFFLIEDDKLVSFCQEHNLIAKEVICSCGNPMRLELTTSSDNCEWTCFNQSHTERPHQTILMGTCFENVNVPIFNVLWIAYMWLHEYSPSSMSHECETSKENLIICCEYCLNMCREIMEHKKNPIGGEGKSVEIFECKITEEDKTPSERWAFCGIEQNSTNSLELLLDNRKSKTVFEIFDKYFLPGTKVVTHNWNVFENLNHRDFLYLINDKSISFYDVAIKRNLDNIQDFKRATVRPPKGLNKWTKLEYGPSFFEKMYRKTLAFSPDAYLTFLKDISEVYKPVGKLVCDSLIKEEVED